MRLAIQDPTPRSDQPFIYEAVTLAYVGELWNASELRLRLEREGAAFQTTGDTEVVAAALSRWGTSALRVLDGMFAMSWTDGSRSYLARDRFGKVPLYVLAAEGSLWPGVAWASERKAFGSLASQAFALPPGTFVALDSPRRLCAYYRPASPARPADLAGAVRELLGPAVKRRMVSDVPVCALISGGMDSAAILALSGITVAYHAYRDPASPDLAAARRLANETNVELREVWVAQPTDESVREAVRTIEVPMKAQVEIALLCLPLARRVREDGFRVLLSGEAADEIFGGYGNLARQATGDDDWRRARAYATAKQARGNFMRVNKVFMASGVEARLPFMDRELVELVLSLGVRDCPPGKGLLKDALRGLVPDWVLARPKETFQGAGGTRDAAARLYPSPRRAYNQMARDEFGVIPRD